MKSATSWETLLSSEAILSENKEYLDLPRDLAQIDIERSLPKLSVLATGGSSYVQVLLLRHQLLTCL